MTGSGHFEKGAWIEDSGRLSDCGTLSEVIPAGAIVCVGVDSHGQIRKVKIMEVD